MLRIGTTVMGVGNLKRAVEFWCAALDYAPKRPLEDGDDFMILVPAGGGPGAHLALDQTETPAPSHPHAHLDLYAGDAADQAAEVERLVALGASRVEWTYPADPDFIVLADTEGNRFCVIDTDTGSG